MDVGKVPEEVEGGHKRSLRVTMTTLRAAPTRHLHTENLSGENLSGERCRYLPKHCPERREGWGAKNNYSLTAHKSNESKMIDSCESTVKSLKGPAKP